MTISVEEVGRRLARSGRSIVEVFEPFEPLFLRCSRSEIEPDGHLSLARVRANQSTNRGRFSRAGWVLHPLHWGNPETGVAEFKSSVVARPLQTTSPYAWESTPVHDPRDDNYAHTEIRIKKDGQYSPTADIPNTVKISIRVAIRDSARVVIAPGAGRSWLENDPGE